MAVLSGRNFVLAAAVAGLFAAMPASADVNTDANALFVGAVQAWTAAAAIPAGVVAPPGPALLRRPALTGVRPSRRPSDIRRGRGSEEN